MKSILSNIVLLIFSVVLFLLITEAVVSLVAPQNLSGSWRVETQKGLKVNKAQGVSRHQLGDQIVNYEFAPSHLRGPLGKGRYKVLILGDSFTFGWLLDEENHYVNLLQKKIDNRFGDGLFVLLNAAAGGWGTGDHVAYIEDFGDDINPDIIILFLNIFDLDRAAKSPLWSFDSAGGSLSRRAAPTSKLKQFVNGLPFYQLLLENSHLLQIARTRMLLINHSPTVDRSLKPEVASEERIDSYSAQMKTPSTVMGEKLFKRLNVWCIKRDITLLITTTGWHEPPYKYNKSSLTETFMVKANNLFTEIGIPFSDPSSDILKKRLMSKKPLIIPNDSHPNEAGAALIADYVFPFVRSEFERYCSAEENRCESIKLVGHPRNK